MNRCSFILPFLIPIKMKCFIYIVKNKHIFILVIFKVEILSHASNFQLFGDAAFLTLNVSEKSIICYICITLDYIFVFRENFTWMSRTHAFLCWPLYRKWIDTQFGNVWTFSTKKIEMIFQLKTDLKTNKIVSIIIPWMYIKLVHALYSVSFFNSFK